MVGKYHRGLDCSSDSSAPSISRALVGAMAADCWLSLDGVHLLTLQVGREEGQCACVCVEGRGGEQVGVA